MVRGDGGAVRRGPAVARREVVDLAAVATPVDERLQSEAREDLRQLRRMPERIGCVADARDGPECGSDAAALEQVADMRFAGGEQHVRLDVPRTDAESTGR